MSAFYDGQAEMLVRSVLHGDDHARIDAATRLLLHSAALLTRREPLPDAAADWLAAALHGIAANGEKPAAALGLARSSGRRTDFARQFARVACMHALVAWGAAKEPAAELVCRHFELTEVSHMVKAYNRALRLWEVKGPLISHLTPDDIAAGETHRPALLDDLRAGRHRIAVSVTIGSFGAGSGYYQLLSAEFRERVINSTLF